MPEDVKHPYQLNGYLRELPNAKEMGWDEEYIKASSEFYYAVQGHDMEKAGKLLQKIKELANA